ncbi:MAG TPA: hypothetical protein VMG39_10650 [Pseudolabrys sp.]|nr:hypothetical protein [Pseudolabrys sp.]
MIGVAAADPGLGQRGIERQRLVVGGERLIENIQSGERPCLVAERLGITGLERQRPVEIGDRFAVAPEVIEGHAPVIPGLRDRSVDGDRLAESLQGFRRTPQRLENESVVVERDVRARTLLQRLPRIILGLGEPAGLHRQDRQQIERTGMRWIGLQQRFEGPLCLANVARLQR